MKILENFLNSLSLQKKLIFFMLMIGIVPLLVAIVVTSTTASSSIQDATLSRLDALRAAKKGQIEDYFTTISNQVITFSEDKMIIAAMTEFRRAFRSLPDELNIDTTTLKNYRQEVSGYYQNSFGKEFETQTGNPTNTKNLIPADASGIVSQYLYIANNPHPLGEKHQLTNAGDSSRYSRLHAKYHPVIKNYLEKFGYYDIFLVDPHTGHIVYTVFKETDYATSLISGPHKDTNFGEVFRKATESNRKDSVHIADFARYLPSYNGPASFISSPIYDGNTLVGVLVFQMPVGKINAIMNQQEGMGETGEMYLIGGDLMMRSQSRHIKDDTILSTRLESPAIKSVLAGKQGNDLVDRSDGKYVVSSYSPLNLKDLNWAILAEVDKDEAFSSISALYT